MSRAPAITQPPAGNWADRVPAGASGTYWGACIHRHIDRSAWGEAIKRVPDDKRPDADRYLRGIARRMRYLRENPPRKDRR